MDRIVEPGSQRFISRFTILEMESVLALKFRTGEIDERSLLTARRRLDADLGSRRLLVATVGDEHLRRARQLVIDHGKTDALRGPDAIQLSVALGLKQAGLAPEPASLALVGIGAAALMVRRRRCLCALR